MGRFNKPKEPNCSSLFTLEIKNPLLAPPKKILKKRFEHKLRPNIPLMQWTARIHRRIPELVWTYSYASSTGRYDSGGLMIHKEISKFIQWIKSLLKKINIKLMTLGVLHSSSSMLRSSSSSSNSIFCKEYQKI